MTGEPYHAEAVHFDGSMPMRIFNPMDDVANASFENAARLADEIAANYKRRGKQRERNGALAVAKAIRSYLPAGSFWVNCGEGGEFTLTGELTDADTRSPRVRAMDEYEEWQQTRMG